MAKQQRNVGY